MSTPHLLILSALLKHQTYYNIKYCLSSLAHIKGLL